MTRLSQPGLSKLNNLKNIYIMNNIKVAIEINGEISTGSVIKGQADIGQTVFIKLQDENGLHIEHCGVVVEVF